MKFSGYGLQLDFGSHKTSDNNGNFEWSWTLEREWSLVTHLGVCLLYYGIVHFLQLYMSKMSGKERMEMQSKWHMESIKFCHNILLSIVSLVMAIVMIQEVYRNGRFHNWHTMACQNTPNVGLYAKANWVYLMTKIWEWMDSFWLILYGKDVIVLHAFHHMTTFTMAAVTHNFPVGGFAFINCIVHFVMYLHFAKPVRWARPFITSFQLIQFVVVLSINTYGYYYRDVKGFCFDFSGVHWDWWYCQLVVCGYFVLFVKFFIENYVPKQKDKKK